MLITHNLFVSLLTGGFVVQNYVDFHHNLDLLYQHVPQVINSEFFLPRLQSTPPFLL